MSTWTDLAITIATAILSALAARYGIKLPPAPKTEEKTKEEKAEPKTPKE